MCPGPSRITIDEREKKKKGWDYQGAAGDKPRQCQGGQGRIIFQLRWKDFAVVGKAIDVHDVSDHLREDEKQDYDGHQPARDELEFVPKAELLSFAAEADEPHPFVE